MGLFSGIAKAVRGVFRGIRKVFAPILKPIGKLFGSKWGKIILIAAAVFTAGMALYAGWAAAAATQGTMMTKFLAGSKAFISAVLNPVSAAKGALKGTGVFAKGAQISGPGAFGWTGGGADATLLAGGEAAAGAAGGVAGAGTTLTETGPMSASVADAGTAGGQGMFGAGGSGSVTGGGPAQIGTQAVDKSGYTDLFKQMAGTTGGESAGLLSKSGQYVKTLGKGFSRFGQSTGGGLLLSNMMQGYSQGKIAEKYEEDRARREAMWSDSPELDRLREVSQRRLQAPANWTGGQGPTDPGMLWRIRQGYTHQPPIPYSSGG